MKKNLVSLLKITLLSAAIASLQSCGKSSTTAPVSVTLTLAQKDSAMIVGKNLTLTAYEGSTDNGKTWTPLAKATQATSFRTGTTFSQTQNQLGTSGLWKVIMASDGITAILLLAPDASSLTVNAATWDYVITPDPVVTATGGGLTLVLIEKRPQDALTIGSTTYTWIRSTYN